MSKMEAQCWICPKCFDDHRQGIKCPEPRVVYVVTRDDYYQSNGIEKVFQFREDAEDYISVEVVGTDCKKTRDHDCWAGQLFGYTIHKKEIE